jgi:GTPase SAR1 family protein
MEIRHSSSIISRKIALIGDGLCGKTSLLLAYLSEDKKFYSRPEPTVLDTCLIKVDLKQNNVKETGFFYDITKSDSFY